ncbi:response regulator [Oceanimonas baumannii]|uniref:DNA-binding response regulator n=1 Tax=Oceanimonas baumannii TaxID=129578 RepID=A0A235CLD1_9GAMM|nr:response regulator [Oceanimonas baumannii]MCC4265587.1 response regulator [Oceanimonas baumannii]OYD25350.1 DNA-binding response regulator [Oceanimonas baumannii]TDW62352.1 two-component system response regulator QseB [Oceanimonas baumannii]
MLLLLIEDDLALGKALLKLLQPHYRLEWVRTLSAAKQYLAVTDADLVLLDLGLPDGDGLHWLQQFRRHQHTQPVLILSARDQLDERVQGLDTGADDYLVKPFEADELLARIRVLLRRSAGSAHPVITAGALEYTPHTDTFILSGDPLTLPPMEHRLLQTLIMAKGRVVPRERLLQQWYGTGNGGDSNTLDVHIHSLRKRLGRERVVTVRGQGYRLASL